MNILVSHLYILLYFVCLALTVSDRANNFPPLPSKCPVKPCFYQDFAVDIPLEFQKLVKMMYFLWLGTYYVSHVVLRHTCQPCVDHTGGD